MKALRIGTRGSQLALWQARFVAAQIASLRGPACELVVIRTTGDHLAQTSLARAGGKRLFVKEIEDALLAGTIDLAVHSAKDMPAVLPDGLLIAAVLPREEPYDALVLPSAGTPARSGDFSAVVSALGRTPRIGTGSIRRTAQLTRLMPGGRFLPARGNVDTRLRKLDAGEYDVVVLAVAGMRRLGVADRIAAVLPVTACVPAPGQGAIAVEARADGGDVRAVVTRTADPLATAAVTAERALVAALGGSCQVPLGALAVPVADELELSAVVVSPDGARALRRSARGPLSQPAPLGHAVARQLLADGAGEILEAVQRAQTGN